MVDLAHTSRRVRRDLPQTFSKTHSLQYYEVSSLTNHRISDVFQAIINKIASQMPPQHRIARSLTKLTFVATIIGPLGVGKTSLALQYTRNSAYFPETAVTVEESLKTLLTRYAVLFRNELGRCTTIKAQLHFKENVIPKFMRPRPLPFALREAAESDLKRQVANGVLTLVETAQWATPIVVVPKTSGSVRVCGDFSVTVNPQLYVAQYPLPRPEELFSKLNGRRKFSKLDLSEAYFQMELEEDTKKYLVINTHQGLFQFNRMPFGISSAPAIFQRTMEQVTAGLGSVACYLDDIIVTRETDQLHIKNFELVFLRLKDYGFTQKKKREMCVYVS
ncbi:hypothetical protein ISCGN_023624 [Ixodes scapularis]